MAHKRPHFGWFLALFIVSVALFLGLFFGLNYKEIIRNGWSLTICTINAASLRPRYCCYSDCSATCGNGGLGAQSCGAMIDQVNNNYNPADCTANGTACPPQIGSTCDGGYYCCGQCCSSCSSCTTSCSGSGNSQMCSQSCTTYSCNCTCCTSTSHRQCTLQCPSCYSVLLMVSYTPYGGPTQSNVSYIQDFAQNRFDAETFFDNHQPNSQTKCYYNPKNYQEITLDVSFTVWKWVVTALFGMIPVLLFLIFTGFWCCYRPIRKCVKKRTKSKIFKAKGVGSGTTEPTSQDAQNGETNESVSSSASSIMEPMKNPNDTKNADRDGEVTGAPPPYEPDEKEKKEPSGS